MLFMIQYNTVSTKRKLLLILLGSIFINGYLMAQDTLDDDHSSPYELMSSYYTNEFKPFQKKNIYTGLAFSLSDRNLTNIDQLIQNVVTGEDISYNVVLKGGYYTGDYGMLGINLEYNEEKFEGTIFREPDTIQSRSISRGYTITPNIRSSVPLTANERLSFFTEVGLSLGIRNGLTRNTKNLDEVETAYNDEFNLRLGISPGITFFAIENFAFEIQLDVLGYELKVKNSEINGEEQSKDVRNNIDFNIDILSLKLGLAYYFGANKRRN